MHYVIYIVDGRAKGMDRAGRWQCADGGGKRLHARNRHLRNHRGCSAAFPMDVHWYFQRNFTCQRYFAKDCHLPSGFVLELPNGFQWHFPMDVHVCDFWRVTFCPEDGRAVDVGQQQHRTPSARDHVGVLRTCQAHLDSRRLSDSLRCRLWMNTSLKFHTCHILSPSEIDLGLFLADFAGSGGRYLFHRIG